MKKIPTWLKGILILIAIYLFAFQPIPFYMEVPGKAFGLDEMVEVNNKFSDDPGEFYITTVGIQQVTPMTALTSIMPYRDLLSEQDLFGDIQDFEEYDVIQQYYMTSSGNTAIQVAFDAAKMPYELQYSGVYVLQIIEESDFADSLKVGDTVKAVDDNTFQSSHDFIDYISKLEVGQEIEIEFERDGETHSATGELMLLESGEPGIGIGLVDNTSLQTDPMVKIHSGEIGGPSAGLMFSLSKFIINWSKKMSMIIIKLLAQGRLLPMGKSGRIGGIEKKIVAADDEGAEYFLAPDDEIPEEVLNIFPDMRSNYEAAAETAEAIASEMEVIPIKTFADALEFLEQLEPKQTTSLMDSRVVLENQLIYSDRQVAGGLN